ncbi:uncharacterized protein LOC128665045 [Bombina bombina]|uniref:uncharacterized protein LOC128665045 n=1 Tax=Bombina bombina TaxID=8345 RepID=UPI00235AFF37|nr:uncharacterized protein LOC128665045 [Bombina bombina]
MGCKFAGVYYVDRCLPMGCSLSCALFEAFSSFLHWVVASEVGSDPIAHYLDDFLIVGRAGSDDCLSTMNIMRSVMRHFGVPLAEDKTQGPASCLVFLGIEIDTQARLCRLPPDKVQGMLEAVRAAVSNAVISLKQLQSLLGLLNFACRVIPMGRVFNRRLERQLSGRSNPKSKITLGSELLADLVVWEQFLTRFNGIRVWRTPPMSSQLLHLFTDAAGSHGYGAYFQGEWSAEPWPESWAPAGLTRNLTLLELFPVVLAVELWGGKLSNRTVVFWTDNISVVFAINNLSATSAKVITLLRHLVLRCLDLNIQFQARHVPGVNNVVADALSRFEWVTFRKLAPTAAAVGLRCPDFLWQLVLPG